MRKPSVIGVAALAAAAGTASAQISPIPPFTGLYTEGFETQTAHVFTQCIQGRIFNGTADLCDPSGNAAHITTGWSFMCTIFPHSSGHFSGSAGGPYELTFDNPVSHFGGYFGTNSGTDGAVVTFYDASNAQIGTANLVTAGCTWTWNGWESAIPFKRLKIVGNNPWGGGFIDMDDLEYQVGGTGPTGACCLPNSSCLVVTAAGCTILNGIYRGEASVCATANCPPGGACCLPNGNCTILTAVVCAAQSGIYRGDNSPCATANCPLPPGVWVEQGEAGDFLENANITSGAGVLNEIRGTLGQIDADMYAIRICSPAAFGATTVNGSQANTQLFLFTASGMGVASNDDDPQTAGSRQSRLTSQFTSSAPAGVYFLAVSGWDKDPQDTGGQALWNDQPVNTERAPDGPGAASPIASWDNSGTGGGAYSIALTGACFAQDVPAACYPNCDASTTAPCLNVLDFTCFLNQFAASATYANCDASTTAPVLNVLDFTCFLNRFAAGCSGC